MKTVIVIQLPISEGKGRYLYLFPTVSWMKTFQGGNDPRKMVFDAVRRPFDIVPADHKKTLIDLVVRIKEGQARCGTEPGGYILHKEIVQVPSLEGEKEKLLVWLVRWHQCGYSTHVTEHTVRFLHNF